jgi:hypothetical protein
MLNGGTLDGEHLTVTSETEHPDEHEPYTAGTPIGQTDKPRAASAFVISSSSRSPLIAPPVAAEYLAKGYVLSDQVLQRAIELDQKNGISARFLGYWNSFDRLAGQKIVGPDATLSGAVTGAVTQADAVVGQKIGGESLSGVVQGHVNTAIGSARSVDEQHGITNKGSDVRLGYRTRHTDTANGVCSTTRRRSPRRTASACAPSTRRHPSRCSTSTRRRSGSRPPNTRWRRPVRRPLRRPALRLRLLTRLHLRRPPSRCTRKRRRRWSEWHFAMESSTLYSYLLCRSMHVLKMRLT